ncbi:MAG: N-acetyltransferase DgcN [Pseudomonadota bacterium]
MRGKMIKTPYAIFLGDANDQLAAKVGNGIAMWRREQCVGQIILKNCNADIGLPTITIEQAAEMGAKTLVIGVANRGGIIAPQWLSTFDQALDLGLDLASGLHQRLSDIETIVTKAKALGRHVFDVRHSTQSFKVADGKKRTGKRLLSVGSDCSVGKMFTSLAIERALKNSDVDADFRATGQTGILICGSGVPIDAIIADFIAGASEALSPDAKPDHWDIIEGQGSLFHPSFAGVSLGLLHGAQPDALVLCHDPKRAHMRGLKHFALPDLQHCIDVNLMHARLVNPNCKLIGISIDSSKMNEDEAKTTLDALEKRFKIPATDPVRFGVANIIHEMV